MEILVRNRNFGQTWKFWPKNQHFGKKWNFRSEIWISFKTPKFLPKESKFWSEMKILVRSRNFGQKTDEQIYFAP